VREAVAQGLPNYLAQAVHVGCARPVEVGQVRVCPKRVALQIFGHIQPVDAADILAPAQQLAHEALHTLQWCVPGIL
jgi:hypothetical protein